jgi:hypothetical protein
MTDPNLRKTRLVGWVILIAAVLVVFDYITGAEWLAFAGGLIQL